MTPWIIHQSGQDFHSVIESSKSDRSQIAGAKNPPRGIEKSRQFISERKKRIKGFLKQDNPNLFAEFLNGIRTREGDTVPSYPPNYQIKELLKARSLKSTRALNKAGSSNLLNWVERGPGNISGRTRGMIVDPDDPTQDTWFAGSVSGGVWKTTNAGQTWINLTPQLPNLATSTLVMAESNHNVLYLGTGEGFGNVDQVDGTGIWKSTDRGMTWEQLASTSDNLEFQNVMRIVVDPITENILLVATNPGFFHLPGTKPSSGIFRSEDGGSTWAKVYNAGSNAVEHLITNPENFNTQYATINSVGVIKSLDGGLNWIDVSRGICDVRRMEIAMAPSDTTTLYISAEGRNTTSTFFISTDAGLTWMAARDITGSDINWLGEQGWYDNTIAVNPYDKHQVFVGGINLWRIDMMPGTDIQGKQILHVDLENTQSFLRFISFEGRFCNGGLDRGENFHGLPTGLTEDDFTTVEIRFGPGQSQKAHRFGWASDHLYPYHDYVRVPLEVWDIEHNQQLMVSFLDHDDNRTWNPRDRASAPGDTSREYIFIHAVPYNAFIPNGNIVKTAGMAFKNTYAIWPESPDGIIFNPADLPIASIRIHWGNLETKRINTTNITDGYRQFGGTPKGVHVDHHNILLVPNNPATNGYRLVNGNDGGVSYSDNGGVTFTQPCNGYNTTQFYGVDKMNGGDRYVGGTQDNGSWLSPLNPGPTSQWFRAPGGDGFDAVWHYTDPLKILESSQFNAIYRSTDGGGTWDYVSSPNGLTDVGTDLGPFFTKIAKSKQDPDMIFAVGRSGVWRSDNFATDWILIPMPEGWNGSSSFSRVKISLANPQIVWAGRNMTEKSPLYVSTDGGVSFTPTPIFPDVILGRITNIETHPTDENTAYALFSFANTPKVLRTTDLGQTWEDLSGFGTNTTSINGFPDVSVRCFLVMPYNPNTIWAGTEIGIFESTDGGQSWAFADNGLPAVAIWEMLIVNQQVVVATHGRGIWTVDLPELSGYEPAAVTLAPRFKWISGGIGGMISAEIHFPSTYDSSFVVIDGERILTFGSHTAPFDTIISFTFLTGTLDTIGVSLSSFKGGVKFINAPTKLLTYPLLDVKSGYINEFNQETTDFIITGFIIATPPGFLNGAIHSPHPYHDGSHLTAILRVPIIVASENAVLRYDDIAIVEPGETGTTFGDFRFWDYVVVEGSSDNGKTWLPLADGYDARYNMTDWLPAYARGMEGDPSMFVTHEVNLLNTFSAGETIIIRFRLFSDTIANAWGWVIDNLDIQGVLSPVESTDRLPTTYSLSQNYPNPFNPITTLNYALPKTTEITLKIYNIMGQEVWRLGQPQKQQAGFYTFTWDGRNHSGTLLPSGVYVYKLEAGEYIKIRKMTLLK